MHTQPLLESIYKRQGKINKNTSYSTTTRTKSWFREKYFEMACLGAKYFLTEWEKEKRVLFASQNRQWENAIFSGSTLFQ